MKKITILIKDNSLIFKYRTKKPVATNLLNTNVISNNELVFSEEYIKENNKIVGMFIYDLVVKENISNITISNNDMALTLLNILTTLPKINCLTLNDNETLTYELCDLISKTSNIEKINCYAIPQFMIEILDNNGIKVESRNEVLYTSNFMLDNDLSSNSSIYYKTSIIFNELINKEDLEDFKVFCQINKYLKVIHVENYNHDNIMNISNIINKYRKKNITIQIHEDINDIDLIEEIKNINKDLKKHKKIKLSLVYSNDYLEKNYIKQIIYTTLKYCSLIIFLIVCSIFFYILYNNYNSEKEVKKISNELKDIMNEEIIEEPNMEEPKIDNTQEEVIEEPLVEEKTIINSYDKLLNVNSDTVGWLTIFNTKIDYPVVQTTDNNYYLNRNFYKDKDYNGWVFMDYRNNPENLDDNTIIYAHNRYYSGVMFGTLNKVTKESWYKNEENLYITYNTLYNNLKWKIFSIYSIDVTNDYLYTNFTNRDEYLSFLNKLKDRSDIELDTPISSDDKILTLSTCLDDNKRLVVHATLVTTNTES